MNNTYEQAKLQRDELQKIVDSASDALRAYPRLENGLVPDSVRCGENYKTAKANFDKAFTALQKFNRSFVKQFKSEIRSKKRSA